MKPLAPQISIIIPVLNEENYIKKVLHCISANASSGQIKEVLVIDGGSADNTIDVAETLGATIISSAKGRAKQMNLGAQLATGNVLYFLHVDSLPPSNFDAQILNAIDKGSKVGCFQLQFDSDSRFLKFFAWFTRINHILCRGGDQSLFITKSLFEKTTGFNEAYVIYEDNEFISRIYKLAPFTILPRYVKTSARRYEEHGEIKLQYYFGVIHLKSFLGAGPEKLYDYYKRKIAT